MWWQQHQSRSADRWTACIWTVWCTAGVAQFYFRFRIGWRHFLQKVNVYQHTEYRQDNSIHDRDITISVLQKETSAILKFFFRCWLWPHHRNPHDILQKIPNFVQIGSATAEIWRHIHFSRWRPLNTTSDFVFVDLTAFKRSKSIRKPNFVDLFQFTAEI